MCGEYSIPIFLIHCTKGSPPHTWRILILKLWVVGQFRITSTYVENTPESLTLNTSPQDHLHIRGEYHDLVKLVRDDNRITSTYVENTQILGHLCKMSWDHLHIRGEYRKVPTVATMLGGSPPHTWRILVLGKNTATSTRITSTYVENTLSEAIRPTGKEDHLHIRGEYKAVIINRAPKRRITSTYVENTAVSLWRSISEIGSPPHTWRIPFHTAIHTNMLRITSTYVENTILYLTNQLSI